MATRGVLNTIPLLEVADALSRHKKKDWGDVSMEDWLSNNYALSHGGRLLSAYHTAEGVKFWIITEADRSATTVLLPEEY